MRTLLGSGLSCATLAALLFLAGCTTTNKVRNPARFLERKPVIAVIPAANSSPEVSAPIVMDKIWCDKLQENGFEIVDSDRVMTYASSKGVSLEDVRKADYVMLGADLSADYLLFNEVMDWGSSFHLTQSVIAVACRSKLVEAKTGGVIWEKDWVYLDQSGSGGNAIANAIVAVVHSVTNSATDGVAKAAERGVNANASTMPYAGRSWDELGRIRTESNR
jgi:hypothetical protein